MQTFPLKQVNEVVELVKAGEVRFRAVLTHAGQFGPEVTSRLAGADATTPRL